MRRTAQTEGLYEKFCQLPKPEQAALADLLRGLVAAKKGKESEVVVWQTFLEKIKQVAPHQTAFVDSMIEKTLFPKAE